MGKQLKIFTIYRCNLYLRTGEFLKTLWETHNKVFAEEFIKSYKCLEATKIKLEEITEDEV